MHHLYLKAKSTILYALPICFLVLLSFGGSFSTAEANEMPSHEIVMVEASVSIGQAVSEAQSVDQSLWDSFWSWTWDWNWLIENLFPEPKTTEIEPIGEYKEEPIKMNGFAWSG